MIYYLIHKTMHCAVNVSIFLTQCMYVLSVISEKSKFRLRLNRLRLRYRYRSSVLVSVPDTDTEFRSDTTALIYIDNALFAILALEVKICYSFHCQLIVVSAKWSIPTETRLSIDNEMANCLSLQYCFVSFTNLHATQMVIKCLRNSFALNCPSNKACQVPTYQVLLHKKSPSQDLEVNKTRLFNFDLSCVVVPNVYWH